MVNFCTLLDYLPIIEPNMGGNLFSRTAHRSEREVASKMLPKFEKNSGLVKDRIKFIKEFKIKSIGMKSQNTWQLLLLLDVLLLPLKL